jgi:hypothetical protein
MDNGHEPATKQDLAEVRQELRQDMAILRSEMNHQFDDLKEAFRDTQTELLKAFYSFTESNRQRVTQLEGNQAALITRIGVLEDRMLELERKVNFPHHPTQ